jgi:hypothetical protein
MIVWAVAALGTLAIIIAIPAVSVYFRLTSLTLTQIAVAVVVPFVTIFWQEGKKLISFREKHKAGGGATEERAVLTSPKRDFNRL